MTDKACCWSITINNPNDDDHKQWAALASLPWVRETKGQLEKGEEGTVHLQGMVKTQSVRFAQVKKALPRAHIEAARNQVALAKYVSKEETRIAPTATIKTATQEDIQNRILEIAQEHLKHWPQTSIEMGQFITTFRYEITKCWEFYLDSAVNKLILEGYYGVEFVVSNPQIRTAFKKYLPAILYRTYNARQAREETQRRQSEEEQSQTSGPQGIPETGGDCSDIGNQS